VSVTTATGTRGTLSIVPIVSRRRVRVVATLYRCRTPTDWLCPCGRVARALKKAGVEPDVVRVPYRKGDREEVEALTGQQHVPVVVLEGEAICDSRRIVEHLAWRRDQDSARDSTTSALSE
jgi:glutaredoxin